MHLQERVVLGRWKAALRGWNGFASSDSRPIEYLFHFSILCNLLSSYISYYCFGLIMVKEEEYKRVPVFQ